MSSVLLSNFESHVVETATGTAKLPKVAKLTGDFKASFPSLLVFRGINGERDHEAVKLFEFLIEFCFIHKYKVNEFLVICKFFFKKDEDFLPHRKV